MKEISDKKAKQRRRKMSYFIDAADKIISSRGIAALNIREVSDIAGFNSATLYGYFLNLDHLVYYSYMKHITEFVQLLNPAFEVARDTLESLEIVLKKYCKFTYENPELVYTLMFSPYSNDFYNILEDYSKIYAKSFRIPTDEKGNLLFKESIFDIIICKLESFEKELNIDYKDRIELNSFIKTYFQGQLVRIMTYDSNINFEEYLSRINRFTNQMIFSYTNEREFQNSIRVL